MKPLKSRILCVEDDLDSCEMLAFMLSSTEDAHEVTGVHHSAQAKVLITTKQFDLYVLDIRLPDTDGLELCKWIRRRDANTPIVFFTANAQEADRRKAMDAGGDAFLIKPNDLDKLTPTVMRLLESSYVAANRKSAFLICESSPQRIYPFH